MGKIVFLDFLIFLFLLTASKAAEDSWSYENTEDWGQDYPQCNGNRQSPIKLSTTNAVNVPYSGLKFVNYNLKFLQPLKAINNGHTVNVEIPGGIRPIITATWLKTPYEAQSLHFHWGSLQSPGSEHTIDSNRYGVEMHIVHKSIKYATMEEALKHSDGLAVLGIVLNQDDNLAKIANYAGLNEVFKNLPRLINYNSTVDITGNLKMNDFLGNLNRNEFFVYLGSLTTPPCSESVTWIVFTDSLGISYSDYENLCKLLDTQGDPLINNFRPTQPLGNRKVYYRSSSILGL